MQPVPHAYVMSTADWAVIPFPFPSARGCVQRWGDQAGTAKRKVGSSNLGSFSFGSWRHRPLSPRTFSHLCRCLRLASDNSDSQLSSHNQRYWRGGCTSPRLPNPKYPKSHPQSPPRTSAPVAAASARCLPSRCHTRHRCAPPPSSTAAMSSHRVLLALGENGVNGVGACATGLPPPAFSWPAGALFPRATVAAFGARGGRISSRWWPATVTPVGM